MSATRRLLLDDGLHSVTAPLQLTHQAFGVVVVRNGDDEIDVPGESRLGARRDGKCSDQRPPATKVVEIPGRAPEDRLKPTQWRGRGQAAGLPGESPN